MLVLLIIFMITAPLMSHKIKVELPQANLDNIADKPQPVQPITLAVTEDGKIYWNDQLVSPSVMESQFSVEAQKTPQPEIRVRGDTTTKFRTINQVMNIAQSQGMRKVGFVATKEHGN
jgi:biopolymer transport protein ExbD